MTVRRTRLFVAVFAVLVLVWTVRVAAAQVSDAAPGAAVNAPGAALAGAGEGDSGSSRSLLAILTAGGPVGVVIMLLSIAAVALVIEHIMTIRTDVLIPPGLGQEVRELLAAGRPDQAQRRCGQQPSFLAFVLGAGLEEVVGGWPAVEKALEDAAAEQSARLFRKIEYLSVIGNIAPMLGLLGTVIGMILAFREVADTQGAARAADLAEGIYLALVTTVEGLIVAIPSLAAFAVFRNRVDHLAAEAAYVAQHAFGPLKRNRLPQRPQEPTPPPVGGQG